MSRYGEPWKIKPEIEDDELAYLVCDSRGSPSAYVTEVNPLFVEEVIKPLRRIVACVNACRHLPQEFLESLGENGLDRAGLTLAKQYAPRRKLEITNG